MPSSLLLRRAALFVSCAVILAIPTWAVANRPQGGGAAGGRVGGVVGTAPSGTRPATPATLSASPSSVPKFLPLAPDPIERPEFRAKAHEIAKSVTSAKAMVIQRGPDGSEIGMTSDVIGTVPIDSRSTTESRAVFINKQAEVGAEMRTSFDEALRAVKLRYPKWEPGRIEFSFGEKYTPHDGGSAGTCFAVMLLSHLEGFDIDPKACLTGDITVDWKVRKIGGLTAKVRGATADKCLYAAIPEENATQLCDLFLLNGDAALRDIQIFSIATLQEAVALLRTDRSPQLMEAIKQFNDLTPKLKAGGRSALLNAQNQKVLEGIMTLAPNHQSARWLLEIGKGTAPKSLTVSTALEELMRITYPYRNIILGKVPAARTTVSQAMTQTATQQLTKLTPVMPKELQPLFQDCKNIVQASELVATRQMQPNGLDVRRKSFVDHINALGSDKELVEKLMRDQ